MINQSWQFNPEIGSTGYYTILKSPEFMQRTEAVKFLSERIGEVAIEPGGQLGVKVDTFSDVPPAPLSEMVKNLPSKRDELKP